MSINYRNRPTSIENLVRHIIRNDTTHDDENPLACRVRRLEDFVGLLVGDLVYGHAIDEKRIVELLGHGDNPEILVEREPK